MRDELKEIANIVEPILDQWFPNDGQRFEAEEIAEAILEWHLKKKYGKLAEPIFRGGKK